MPHQQYLPHAIAKIILWMTNFAGKIGGYATSFNLDTAKVAKAVAANTMLVFVEQKIKDAITYKEALVAYQTKIMKGKTSTQPTFPTLAAVGVIPALVDEGIFTNLVPDLVDTVKANNTNYNDVVGRDLDVIGAASTFDALTFKPWIKEVLKAGHGVEITFEKSHTEGGNVYSRLKGTSTWTRIAYVHHPHFLDARPLTVPNVPEEREYYVQGIIGDELIGVPSDIVTAVYAG